MAFVSIRFYCPLNQKLPLFNSANTFIEETWDPQSLILDLAYRRGGEGQGKDSRVVSDLWNMNALVCVPSTMGDHKKIGSGVSLSGNLLPAVYYGWLLLW